MHAPFLQKRSAGHGYCSPPSEHVGMHAPPRHTYPAAHEALLSMTPSQSLSLPSQISVVGPTPPWHFQPSLPRQAKVPGRHSQNMGWPAAMPAGLQLSPGGTTPSSTLPLQSLSLPSQSSAVGPTESQMILPPLQMDRPD